MEEIQTDVDRLLHALHDAPGQHLTVGELSRQLGLTTAQVKRLSTILEHEKRARIYYTFSDVHVAWMAPPAKPPAHGRGHVGHPHGHQTHASYDSGSHMSEHPSSAIEFTKSEPRPAPEPHPAADNAAPQTPQAQDQDAQTSDASAGSYYSMGETHAHKPMASAAQEPTPSQTPVDLAREIEARYQQELEKRQNKRQTSEQMTPSHEARAHESQEQPSELESESAQSQQPAPTPEVLRHAAQARAAPKPIAEEMPAQAPVQTSGESFSTLPADMGSTHQAEIRESHRRAPHSTFVGGRKISSASGASIGSREAPASSRAHAVAAHESIIFSPEVQLPPMPPMDDEALRLNSKLEAAMARIQAKGAEIDALKEKKRQLLREVYRPLERKMESGAESIAEQLLKYENRLLKLRERAGQLPQEVADLDERQAQMQQVAHEMQRVYDETANLLQDSLSSVMESRERAASQLQAVRQGLGTQEMQVGQMKAALSDISAAQAEAEARLAEARLALEEEQARLNRSQQEMSQLSSAKAQLEGEVQTALGELKMQKRSLQDMDTHLSKIDQVKEWVEKNREQYDTRMQELADYVRGSEEEYASLRESVEAGFARRHLHDLRALSESYEFELTQANQMEQNVDAQIQQARAEMGSLIAQAKRIAQMQEMQLEEGEGERHAQAKQALGRQAMFAGLSSQEKERTRIRGMIRDVIEGKAPAEGTVGTRVLGYANGARPKAASRAGKKKKTGRKR